MISVSLGDFLLVVNTVFQWTFGANTVELTGTFTNWENPIPLKKMENNCFEIILVIQFRKNKWEFVSSLIVEISILVRNSAQEYININTSLTQNGDFHRMIPLATTKMATLTISSTLQISKGACR
jgi:hypothetical protein